MQKKNMEAIPGRKPGSAKVHPGGVSVGSPSKVISNTAVREAMERANDK